MEPFISVMSYGDVPYRLPNSLGGKFGGTVVTTFYTIFCVHATLETLYINLWWQGSIIVRWSLRRWPNIDPAMDECLLFAGLSLIHRIGVICN